MSTPLGKSVKSKFLSEDLEDLLNESTFNKEPAAKPTRKSQKRQSTKPVEDEESIEIFKTSSKKTKCDVESGLVRSKILHVMETQINTRKEASHSLLKNLSEVIADMKADNVALKSNKQKLQQLTTALIKCMEQSIQANDQKIKVLNEQFTTFKKEVEGLILRGGIKPDDRPLWFDVYKSFPPTVEPKYAKPLPEIKPIRQILYKEDELRAKFHSKGHGFGATNMLSPGGETHTKKLLKEYEKLQSQGVPEDELLEKTVEAVGIERRERIAATAIERSDRKAAPGITENINQESATAQILKEADIGNIFKEK